MARRAVVRREGVALVTMARDEEVFLPLWVAHHARYVPRSAIHILLDGLDQALPKGCEGCQALRVPHFGAFEGFERARWDLLWRFVSALTMKYAAVAYLDADEMLVLDPARGEDLADAMARASAEAGVVSPFGLELLHRRDLEPAPLDLTRPVLGQRRHVRVNAMYAKPCVTSVPLRWGVGGHYADHPRLTLSGELFLIHLRLMDAGLLAERHMRRLGFVSSVAGEVAGGSWSRDVEETLAVLARFETAGTPVQDDFSFARQRRRIERSWMQGKDGLWRIGKLHNQITYALPERFLGLF